MLSFIFMIKLDEIDISVMLAFNDRCYLCLHLHLHSYYNIRTVCIEFLISFQEDFLRLFVLIKRNLMISN